ncbi:ketopantoate reductase family protein [Desulfoglaeba alkanexedens]|uniref:2-dehydropantoate 2-reductase n=1 Tax=Desulfoglaeba alkanexedens ALDC TaxID=980445 RepID=A0A4V1ERF6_9BACT|nr:ketopantoate reductase family protein [Desulfoglaeba alkanexedens]QCQ21471.1 ketopantoate reductase family protein [Desulfoglaeba alkanexedens ALDC]
MKIGVMGTGGVGGYFGGLLARSGSDIHFIARGKHLRALQDEGLELVTNHGNFRVRIHATAEADEIGPVDLLLFCVKSHDTDQAAQLAEPMVVEETVVLSLQNGIDNVDKLSAHFGRERVMGGTAYIESTIASPGVIAHTGKPGRLVFGELNGERTARAEAVLDVFLKAGIDAELTTRIHEVLWSKFLFICGVHGVSTLSRSTLGLVLASPETRDLLENVMREVETLARKRGIALEDDVVRQSMELAQSYNKRFKCSMLRDLEWHRPMEIEALNGMVVRLGKEAGIQTPLNQVIYACLKLENKKIINPVWASQLTD